MTIGECPVHHLPKHLASKRTTPTEHPKHAITTTRIWTNPFYSTTAPQSWNNQPIPMDLDITQAPRGNWRGWGRGQLRGNVAKTDDIRTQQGIQGACFNCGQQGQFAHNCPTKQKCTNTQTAQLIDWSPEDNESDSGTIAVDSLYQQLNTLPKDDQEELMAWMGAQEGNFLEA